MLSKRMHVTAGPVTACAFLIFLGLPTAADSQFPPVINLTQTSADIEVYGLFSGCPSGDHSGYALSSGDINGDGAPDLVIASYEAGPLGCQRNGELEIVWNAALQQSGSIDMANSANVSRIFGKASDNPLFPRLACGDFNNDGNGDIIYGHPYGLNSFADGMAYVIFGDSPFPDTLDLQTNPPNVVTVLGGPWSGSLGRAVCACDMNGDGYDEIILSAPRMTYGEVYVIHGGMTFQAVYNMSGAVAGVTRIIDNIADNQTGESLACQDVDGDGYDDLLIGSEGAVAFQRHGMAVLLYGKAQLPDTISLSSPDFEMRKIYGEPYSDGRLGHQVAIGDINGDGKKDVALAAPTADPAGCRDCGEIYVLYSVDELSDSTYVGSTSLPMTRLLGETEYQDWGLRLHSSDLTGDGFHEIVIGDLGGSSGPLETVVVVYGQATLPDSIFLETDTLVTRIRSEGIGDDLAKGMASADFNSDNVNDLVLGADWADPLGRSNAGTTYLFFGVSTLTGVNPPPSAVFLQNYPNPFATSTTIEYELARESPVVVTIYNALGQLVARMESPLQLAGRQRITWNGLDSSGRKVASGIYFYRLQAGQLSQTRKMVILR